MGDEIDVAELIALKELEPSAIKKLNPVLRFLICGLTDPGCRFYALNGTPHIIEKIWIMLVQYWKNHILIPDEFDFLPSKAEGNSFDAYLIDLGQVKFPEPSDINVTMMPFIMSRSFEDTKLPDYLRPYWDTIICREYTFTSQGYAYGPPYRNRLVPRGESGSIGFITVHEGLVKKGESQHRTGLHTQTPGKMFVRTEDYWKYTVVKSSDVIQCDKVVCTVGKGGTERIDMDWGFWQSTVVAGGLFVASTIHDSGRMWNCAVDSDASGGTEVIGTNGDIEHLREFLPHSCCEKMKQNCVYWLTDRTPYESLPLPTDTYCQYFQLVTSAVNVWFEDQSTPNPLGVLPDPERTIIVKGFAF